MRFGVLTLTACTTVLLLTAVAASAQTNTPASVIIPSAPQPLAPSAQPSVHAFWDKTNIALFSGVAASRALDYNSTGHFRARGFNEGLLTNAIVDNKPLFATIEIAATVASVAVSYMFHRTNHHKLERWVSVVHIGITVYGAAKNYSLKRPPS